MICDRCGLENTPSDKYCIRCGQALKQSNAVSNSNPFPDHLNKSQNTAPQGQARCNKCGNQLNKFDRFCNKCGTPVKLETTTYTIKKQADKSNLKFIYSTSIILIIVYMICVFMSILDINEFIELRQIAQGSGYAIMRTINRSIQAFYIQLIVCIISAAATAFTLLTIIRLNKSTNSVEAKLLHAKRLSFASTIQMLAAIIVFVVHMYVSNAISPLTDIILFGDVSYYSIFVLALGGMGVSIVAVIKSTAYRSALKNGKLNQSDNNSDDIFF